MAHPTHPGRSYRCSYHPRYLSGHLVAAETGVLPSLRVQAANAERIDPEDELAGVV